MKNLHFILCIFVSLTCMTAVQSCIKDKIEEDPSKILLNMVSVDKPELDFVVIEDVKNFTITSRFSWKITAKELNGTDGGWYTISVVSGDGDDEINVTTKPNPTEALRTATLIITGRYNAVEVIISQAKDGEGMLNEDAITLADFNVIEAETQAFEIKSPFEWTITFKDKTTYSDPENPAIDPQWASVDVVDGEGDRKITVTVKDNKTGDKRIGEFTITAVGKTKIVIVNQIAVVYDMFDPEFFAWCIDPTKGNVDTDGDGSISAEEAEAVTIINCSFSALGSLKGVENFTELTELRCYSNKLTALNVSKNTKLTTFVCFYNNLGTLDVSKNTELTYLDCAFNDLTELDVSKNTELTKLSCIRNKLTALDVSKNTELTELVCYDNNLGTLDMSKNTKLTALDCAGNKLGTLDVSKNTKLTTLNCIRNKLTALDVSQNTELTTLVCANNGLIALDVSKNTGLTYLVCSDNKLTALDMSKNTKLTALDCYSNVLTELDVSQNTVLFELNCYSNSDLAKINISGSLFTILKDFKCNPIAPDAEIHVWDGFNPKNIPTGNWQVSSTTYWKVPTLSYAFSTKFLIWCLDPNNGIDTDGDSSISAAEAEAVTIINCNFSSLGSLKGIENFTELTELRCYSNNLTALNVSKNTKLAGLGCSDNILTTLDVSKNTELTELDCRNNKLTTLDVSKNTELTELVCIFNNLTALDVSKNAELAGLGCSDNILTTLDVSQNTKLTKLYCNNNVLNALDVSKNTVLTALSCIFNKLTTLDVSQNTVLTYLDCNNNILTALDMSKNTKLTNLSCHSSPKLAEINISGSSFTTLINFKCNPIAPNAEIYVWSGFNIDDKPTASSWSYPVDIKWMVRP